jgi:hypothetical protein
MGGNGCLGVDDRAGRCPGDVAAVVGTSADLLSFARIVIASQGRRVEAHRRLVIVR